MKHVTVFAKQGVFAGWPANHGIWQHGSRICVGFGTGWWKENGPNAHSIQSLKMVAMNHAISDDAGETWQAHPTLPERGEHGPLDFKAPGFCLRFNMEHHQTGTSHYFFSRDCGDQWFGPYPVPAFGFSGVMARTDYIVLGKKKCLAFMTASKHTAKEGFPYCIETTDGGVNWKCKSRIGSCPKDQEGFRIMPASVRIKGKKIVSLIRCLQVTQSGIPWTSIEAWKSEDTGKTWTGIEFPINPTEHKGNPVSITKLRDGRLVIVYGVRHGGVGIRARISTDEAETWGDEIIIRGDGETWDLGYPRTVQRADGKLVSVYYMSWPSRGLSAIEATIWEAP